MTTLTALATAGLLARLCLAAGPEGDPGAVRIEGDVTYQPGTGRVLVENGAVLRRGEVVVRAPTASLDPATGEVHATGGVLLTDATRVVAADALRAVLGGEWEAEGVVAFVKEGRADLSAVATLEEARRAGRNRLSFSGARLAGDAAGRFTLRDARLTLCDCPAGAPSWEVTAAKADVVPGKRVTLSWPVLRVTPRFLLVDRPVPVLVLPWMYLPLGDRQTGFLLPEVRSVASTGFALAQPLFVTLGRSADATLTAEYAFGRGLDLGNPRNPRVRGPGARLELRWAPAAGAEGRAEAAWVHDLDDEPGGARGHRLALDAEHGQRLSSRTTLQGRLRLASDGVWLRDRSSDVLARSASYRRSDLLLSRGGDALVLEAGASYLQPLCPTGADAPEGTVGTRGCQGYGTLGAGLDVASRWPALAATLVPVAAGPLRISARAGAARWAPVAGGVDRDGRPAATRADARAEVSLPLLLGGAVSFTPYLRGAAAGYAFEADVGALASGWGVAGAVLATEVSRRFGALRHAVAPRLEWRAGTDVAGDALGWLAYDALDRTGAGLLSSAPPGAWQQLRAAVETRLASAGAERLRLELGQDLDLRSGDFAETFAAARASAGRLSIDAGARFFALDDRPFPAPSPRIPSDLLDRFTELRASATLASRRGDALRAGFFAVGPGGSGTLVAGVDPLFDVRAARLDAAVYATAGASVVISGATLAYDALFPGRATFVPTCSGAAGSERRVEAWQVQQHTATLAWRSPCRCFDLAALVRVDDCGGVSYGASIDLARLASARPAP